MDTQHIEVEPEQPALPEWILRSLAATQGIDQSTPRGQVAYYLTILAEQHHSMNRGGAGFGYVDPAEFVLAEGEWFTPSLLPTRFRRMPQKQCFMNAWALARRHPNELTYVEGFAQGFITVHHAWCVDKQGQVVDPTWDWGSEHHPIHGESMVGVRFSHEVMRLHHKLRKGEASVLQLWQYDFPILIERPYDAESYQRRIAQIVAGEQALSPVPRRG